MLVLGSNDPASFKSLTTSILVSPTALANLFAICAIRLSAVVAARVDRASFKLPARNSPRTPGCNGTSSPITEPRASFFSNMLASSSRLARKSWRISASICACSAISLAASLASR